MVVAVSDAVGLRLVKWHIFSSVCPCIVRLPSEGHFDQPRDANLNDGNHMGTTEAKIHQHLLFPRLHPAWNWVQTATGIPPIISSCHF